MVRVSSPAKLRPWSELTAKMVMRVVPGLVITGRLGDFTMEMNGGSAASYLSTSRAPFVSLCFVFSKRIWRQRDF